MSDLFGRTVGSIKDVCLGEDGLHLEISFFSEEALIFSKLSLLIAFLEKKEEKKVIPLFGNSELSSNLILLVKIPSDLVVERGISWIKISHLKKNNAIGRLFRVS